MKKELASILVFGLLMSLLGCQQEETYKDLPKAVYIVNKAPEGAANMTNSTSARKTVGAGVARVYVNVPYEKDVVVTYTLAGTAVAGQDYTPPASNTVTVPAGKYFGEINFTVLNNPAQTTARTVVVTMTNATEGFQLGIGWPRGYSVFTYTITP